MPRGSRISAYADTSTAIECQPAPPSLHSPFLLLLSPSSLLLCSSLPPYDPPFLPLFPPPSTGEGRAQPVYRSIWRCHDFQQRGEWMYVCMYSVLVCGCGCGGYKYIMWGYVGVGVVGIRTLCGGMWVWWWWVYVHYVWVEYTL